MEDRAEPRRATGDERGRAAGASAVDGRGGAIRPDEPDRSGEPIGEIAGRAGS